MTEYEGNPDYRAGSPHTMVPSFRHAAAPTKPIVGVVRDKDTKTAARRAHDPEPVR